MRAHTHTHMRLWPTNSLPRHGAPVLSQYPGTLPQFVATAHAAHIPNTKYQIHNILVAQVHSGDRTRGAAGLAGSPPRGRNARATRAVMFRRRSGVPPPGFTPASRTALQRALRTWCACCTRTSGPTRGVGCRARGDGTQLPRSLAVRAREGRLRPRPHTEPHAVRRSNDAALVAAARRAKITRLGGQNFRISEFQNLFMVNSTRLRRQHYPAKAYPRPNNCGHQ